MAINLDSMSRLIKNKYLKVFGITSVLTTLYLSFGFFRSLWPYQPWFKNISIVYALSILVFVGLVGVSHLYSLIAVILAKLKKKELHPLVMMGPAISSMIMIGFIMAPVMPKFLPTGSHLKAFDSEQWIDENSTEMRDGINERQKMLGDAVENILPGKSRNEIIRLLGLSSDDSNQSTLLYYLGPARADFFGVEDEWLEVYFDPAGKFEKYQFFRTD